MYGKAAALRVKPLAGDEHFDVASNTRCARRGKLGVMDAIQDRVAVGAVERREGCAGRRVGCERLLEVVGHGRRTLTGVGRLPAAVRRGARDLGAAGGAHAAGAGERGRLVAVDLRPAAARSAWREALTEEG